MNKPDLSAKVFHTFYLINMKIHETHRHERMTKYVSVSYRLLKVEIRPCLKEAVVIDGWLNVLRISSRMLCSVDGLIRI